MSGDMLLEHLVQLMKIVPKQEHVTKHLIIAMMCLHTLHNVGMSHERTNTMSMMEG